jgi:hypothetical protein
MKLNEIEDSIAFLEEQKPGMTKLIKSELSLHNKSALNENLLLNYYITKVSMQSV